MHRTILSAGFVSDSRVLSDLLGAATRGIEPFHRFTFVKASGNAVS
jgi:hypothetical protein